MEAIISNPCPEYQTYGLILRDRNHWGLTRQNECEERSNYFI